MNYNFITKRQADKVSDSRKLITKQTFFTNSDRVGYFEKDSFSDLMRQLKEDAPGLLKQYNEFFSCVKDGLTITSGLSKNKHKVNNAEYYFIRFKTGNVDITATVYDVERLGQFIKDYAYGMIKIDFTLDELIEEARGN